MTDDSNVQRIITVLDGLSVELASTKTHDAALRLLTARSLEVVDGAQDAGISRARDGGFETVAETSDIALQVDAIQYALGSGPCVDAATEHKMYNAEDLRTDTRWPEFGRRAAAETGVVSMLSFRLFFEDDDYVAAMNMYSTQTHAFGDDDQVAGLTLAMFGALTVTNARRQDRIVNLERALETNREIGVAIGVLMALHRVTRDQAFDLLRVVSQKDHRKLADVARDVAETGSLEIR